jgi:hypothetical protein
MVFPVRRLTALWILGVALLTTLLVRLVKRSGGLARFRAQFDPEGLVPIDCDEREVLAASGRCLACTLCDRGEGPRRAAAQGRYPGLMALVLASTRRLDDLEAAAEGFRFVPDAVLAAQEAVCPARVPIRRLALLVQRRAGQVDGLRPAS